MLITTRAAIAICAVSALVMLEQPVAGQQSSPPLDQTIAVGQVVSVQTTDGRTLEGTVSAVSPTVLDLNLDSRSRGHLTIDQIRQVDLEYYEPSHHATLKATMKGLLTGLAAGATLGALLAYNDCGSTSNPDLTLCNPEGLKISGLFFGGIGAGVGALTGYALREDLNARRTVWKAAPPSDDHSGARLILPPHPSQTYAGQDHSGRRDKTPGS